MDRLVAVSITNSVQFLGVCEKLNSVCFSFINWRIAFQPESLVFDRIDDCDRSYSEVIELVFLVVVEGKKIVIRLCYFYQNNFKLSAIIFHQ